MLLLGFLGDLCSSSQYGSGNHASNFKESFYKDELGGRKECSRDMQMRTEDGEVRSDMNRDQGGGLKRILDFLLTVIFNQN